MEPSPRTSTPARSRDGPASSTRATTCWIGSNLRSFVSIGLASASSASSRARDSSEWSALSSESSFSRSTFAPARTTRR
jgi:hypothetical protein